MKSISTINPANPEGFNLFSKGCPKLLISEKWVCHYVSSPAISNTLCNIQSKDWEAPLQAMQSPNLAKSLYSLHEAMMCILQIVVVEKGMEFKGEQR